MAAETGFTINGTLYEVPDMSTLTMDEIRVLYDYSGLGLEDFAEPADESPDEAVERERRLRNPGFLTALMHIAYQRGNPKVPAGKVKALIGSSNVLDVVATLTNQDDPGEPEDGEGDDVPPVLTSGPEGSSSTSSLVNDSSKPVSSGSSGPGSTIGSDGRDVTLAATGTSR